MDPPRDKDTNFPNNLKNGKSANHSNEGKKYHGNQQQDNNDLTSARPNNRQSNNITNGVCGNSSDCNINNNNNIDPYSVSYNVDSKISIDKCRTGKERSNDGYMPWNLHPVEGYSGKINNIQCEGLNIVEAGHSSGLQNGSVNNRNYFNINVPSTSGMGGQVQNIRNNRKRAKRRDRAVDDDSSSDTGNDDYSAGSDECCIYTYRGGEHLADLPSSFYSLDMGEGASLPAPPLFPSRQQPPNRNSASSPDMDYLEMDFDPGPSCEADSDRESSCDLDLDADHSDENQEVPEDDNPQQENIIEVEIQQEILATEPEPKIDTVNVIETSMDVEDRFSPVASTSGGGVGGTLVTHTQPSGRVVVVRRTCKSWPAWDGSGLHTASGDLVSPGDSAECDLPESIVWPSLCNESGEGVVEGGRHNLASALFHCTMAKRLTVHRTDAFLQDQDTSNVDGTSMERPVVVSKTMVWSEQEACSRQVTQISTSACGATAVINTLLALNQTIEVDRVVNAVGTRLRACSAPLPRYLISRSVAGCDHTGLARGLATARVHSRHFATWPERAISLSHWLAYWIELGAVPIVTLNLQSGVMEPSRIPDSWHHQMVFGVGPRGVYLTNPLECVDEGALWHHLTSDSVLLVRRKDIISRWTGETDLTPLARVPGDVRWRTMNVLGQVVNIIRESQVCESPTGQQPTGTTHCRIPACYRAGVTIAALHGSEAHRRLLVASELPLLSH